MDVEYDVKGKTLKVAKETHTYETEAVVLLPFDEDEKAVEVTSRGVRILAWDGACAWYTPFFDRDIHAPIEIIHKAIEMWEEVKA